MKKLYSLFFIFIIWLFPHAALAQQYHFIYLQSDARQPFYAKLNNKVLSSSLSGYLILPKLKEGDYKVAVGFLGDDKKEQQYSLAVNDNDAGYLIKDFGEKGWGLFNLQTLDVVMAGGKKESIVVKEEKADEFSTMLSEAVNDPSIKRKEEIKIDEEKDIVVEQPKKKKQKEEKIEPEKEMAKEEVAVEKPKEEKLVTKPEEEIAKVNETPKPKKDLNEEKPVEEVTKVVEKTEPKSDVKIPEKEKAIVKPQEEVVATPMPVDKTSDLYRKLMATSDKGIDAVYIDNNDGVKDTIQIFIPLETLVVENKKEETLVVKSEPKKNDEAKALPSNKPPMINSDCKQVADEDDFNKLRSKMVDAEDSDKMLEIAKKYFKKKCYTTTQIKGLGGLFVREAERYSFFDLAYPFSSDSYNFHRLETELVDPYYINRFKALVKH